MSTTLTHDAMIYGNDDAYLATTVPFLREGIERGEGTVVATHERNRASIGHALGAAAHDVVFVPSSEVYRSPQAAIAAYDNVIEMFRKQGRTSIRAIGEVAYPADERAHDDWLRYEPLAHSVFSDAPLHVICPYDTRALPGRLIDHARRTHPHVHADTARQPSSAFEDPTGILRAFMPPLPFDTSAPPALEIDGSALSARAARMRFEQLIARALPHERVAEAVLAFAEMLANASRHGDGPATAQTWIFDEAVLCRVRNDGPAITDPCAGYRPPSRAEVGGRGLWLARQLADGFAIEHDARGPIVSLAFLR